MKVILFMVIAFFAIGCATTDKPDFSFKGEVVAKVEFVKGEKVVDGSCGIKITKDAEGVIVDSKCVGFFSDETGTYKCEVGLGSDGQPITKRIDVTTSCNLDITK
jgi:hypothetical protein